MRKVFECIFLCFFRLLIVNGYYRGKFAVCWYAKHRKTGKEYAAKIVKKRRRGKAVKPEVIHEIAVLESCSHCPYIVNLYEVFEDDVEMVLILELWVHAVRI